MPTVRFKLNDMPGVSSQRRAQIENEVQTRIQQEIDSGLRTSLIDDRMYAFVGEILRRLAMHGIEVKSSDYTLSVDTVEVN